MNPIGFISNERNEIIDDNWGSVISQITIDDSISENALDELTSFSHIYVLFYFHMVDDSKIVIDSRHPRNNTNYPKVGIFAQRAKNRMNKIGLTLCELIKVDGRVLTVRNLDAINGTPVLDIKPYMKEFENIEELRQPDWSCELMDSYFNK